MLRCNLFLFFGNVFKGLCVFQVSAARCSFVGKSTEIETIHYVLQERHL